jgi:hypothetical protein
MMSKLCASIIAICTIIGLFFGAYQFNEQRYALAKTVQLVELRLEQKIQIDTLDDLQNRYWKLFDRCNKMNCTDFEWNELRELKEKLEAQKEKVNMIQQKIIQ